MGYKIGGLGKTAGGPGVGVGVGEIALSRYAILLASYAKRHPEPDWTCGWTRASL
jgi:hypothetical protein